MMDRRYRITRVYVVDGDTIECQVAIFRGRGPNRRPIYTDRMRVRLDGIDAPELSQPYGREALTKQKPRWELHFAAMAKGVAVFIISASARACKRVRQRCFTSSLR